MISFTSYWGIHWLFSLLHSIFWLQIQCAADKTQNLLIRAPPHFAPSAENIWYLTWKYFTISFYINLATQIKHTKEYDLPSTPQRSYCKLIRFNPIPPRLLWYRMAQIIIYIKSWGCKNEIGLRIHSIKVMTVSIISIFAYWSKMLSWVKLNLNL